MTTIKILGYGLRRWKIMMIINDNDNNNDNKLKIIIIIKGSTYRFQQVEVNKDKSRVY